MVSGTDLHWLAYRIPHSLALCVTSSIWCLHRPTKRCMRGHSEDCTAASYIHREHATDESLLRWIDRQFSTSE